MYCVFQVIKQRNLRQGLRPMLTPQAKVKASTYEKTYKFSVGVEKRLRLHGR